MSMVTTKATSTALPPPRIYSLGPSQRARLLRSTRKLENVLGAIPQVVEPENVPLYERSKSQNVHAYNPTTFLSEPTISTAECLEHSEAASRNAIARKHIKHRREYSESSADSAQVLTFPSPDMAMPSPLSSLFASEDEPMSPIPAPQEKIRRRRMAKLTRTLGENSPTEFIFPHDHLKLTHHQRSPSEPSARSLWPHWEEEESEAAPVVSNNTMPTTVPPPTINSLDPFQRARLLKSTRKLDNFLGATPQVEESAALRPITTNSRRISFPVSSDPVDSHESLKLVPTSLRLSQNGPAEKHSKHKLVHLPRPLLLHPDNVSDVTKPNITIERSESSPDSVQVLTLPSPEIATPSPLSSLFVSEDEPMSPIQVPQEKIRRRRMAKLTRTLGENIPTEFILPHDHLKLTQHQRSPSEPSARSLWPGWGEKESEAASVVTNNTMPPPTINSLDPSQRARLLKSTRKLENLLGATPQVEESPPVTANSRRISFPVSSANSPGSRERVPTSLRSSQNGPAEKHGKHRSMQHPRPLVLRHNNVSAVTKLNVRIEQPSSADPAQVLTLPHTAIASPSPLSPLFTPGDEPMSPMDVPQEKIRRMRMAKLTRTLGENIPTELILPHGHLKFIQHQRSPSEPSPRSLWPDWGGKESEAASVVTNNTFSTTVPPPTINSLDPSQRTRLLKSTRKLENLLGATPQVEESAVLPPVTTNSRRISFPVSSSDSADSHELVPTSLRLSQNGPAEKHSKNKSAHLPRPLVLRHNNMSAITKLNVRIEQPPSADSPQILTLPRTTIASPSPLFATEDEPMSPMDVPQEKIRRMRMAKLTRTLGENIPTEFILTHDHLKLSQHQRSPSEPSPRSLWPDWTKKEGEGTAALPLLSKGRPQITSVEDNGPTFTNATIVPSYRSKIRKLRRRPQSVGPAEVVLSSTLFTVTPSSPERPSSPVILSDSETTEDDDLDVIVGSDWRGEWNIKDAQERAMALRNLKGH